MSALRRFAFARPHLLLIEGLDGTRARLAAERWAREHGWPLAETPLDADVVAVCGRVDAAPLELLTAQVPAPWALARLGDALIEEPLTAAGRALVTERPPTRAPARRGPSGAEASVPDLRVPRYAPDRDGLNLQSFKLRLGPALAAWPPGLSVRLTLQGDVIQEAEATAAVAYTSFWEDPWVRALRGERVTVAEAQRHLAASFLDSLGRLLTVAGADALALAAARSRDATLDCRTPRAEVSDLTARVRRSRLLRWASEGLGPLPSTAAVRLGVGGPARRADGDAWDRLNQWLDEAADALGHAASATGLLGGSALEGPRGALGGGRALVEALPDLLVGQEVAAARIIVASLDPEPAAAQSRPAAAQNEPVAWISEDARDA